MIIVGLLRPVGACRLSAKQLILRSYGVVLAALAGSALGAAPDVSGIAQTRLEAPFVVAQLPAGTDVEKRPPVAGGMLRSDYGDGARLVLVSPDGSARVLTAGFHSACDPDVSFDAARILFAGKRVASDPWNIYEMAIDGSGLRQIILDKEDLGDCRSPSYQSTLYRLPPVGVPPQPWHQITFVASAGTMNEYGDGAATNLYACKLDGSTVRRLTYNLSSDLDPVVMSDGRLVFGSWQRARLHSSRQQAAESRQQGVNGLLGRIGLFGINIDGTDYALFAGYEGKRIKHMPATTAGGLVVFVEADKVPWDGAGSLACVEVRRPLHSYRQITDESDGLFHSPSPLADGRILVSRRPADGSRTHGVWRLDPSTGKGVPVFDDPRYHEIHAKSIYPREEPDGRSSVVTEDDPHGKLYCLNVYTSDLAERDWMPPGTVKRLRVLEGVPLRGGQGTGNRGQGTGDREQGTGDRGQGTGNRGQGTGARAGQRAAKNGKRKAETRRSRSRFPLSAFRFPVN